MYSPASYTLLGISLTLATLSLVGTGGIKWWYLKEVSKAGKDHHDDHDDHDDGHDDKFSARCRSSAAAGDDASAGLDLHLSQYHDRVVIEGIIERNNADGRLQVLLSTDTSCRSPTNFISSTFSESDDDDDNESGVEDWSIRQDLEDTIGNVIVVQDASNDQLGCCIVRRRR